MSNRDYCYFCMGEVASPQILALGKGQGDPAYTKLGQGFYVVYYCIHFIIKSQC